MFGSFFGSYTNFASSVDRAESFALKSAFFRFAFIYISKNTVSRFKVQKEEGQTWKFTKRHKEAEVCPKLLAVHRKRSH